MTVTAAFFGFDGRFGRLTFVKYTYLSAIIAVTLAPISIHMALFNRIMGFVAFAAILIFLIWTGLAFLAKRLHDLGWNGAHAIWIFLLAIGNTFIPTRFFPVTAATVSALCFCIALYLLFAPGQQRTNKYGLVFTSGGDADAAKDVSDQLPRSSVFKKLFSFKGRMKRLPYVGYNVVIVIVVAVGNIVALNFDSTTAIVLISCLLGLGLWAYLVISIKRLHDLGMAGTHSIWICAVAVTLVTLPDLTSVFAILGAIILVCTAAYLAFASGDLKENAYGPA